MNCITVNDVSEYISIIKKIIQSDRKKEKFYIRNEYLFRGHSDETYELMPSLGRLNSGRALYFVERNLIYMAKRKMPNIFTEDLQPIELLGLLQHYGIPTRLLDVTENALVALYFACCENLEKNGEIFIFKNDTFDVSDYPIDYAIAESYKFARPSSWPLKEYYKEIINQDYFTEQRVILDHKDNTEGALWVEECYKKPIFTYAPYRIIRQQIQAGRYILFPNKINHISDTEPGTISSHIQSLEKDDSCIAGRILIPASLKKSFLDEMSYLGMKKDNLFIDSVDFVCNEIKERYFR